MRLSIQEVLIMPISNFNFGVNLGLRTCVLGGRGNGKAKNGAMIMGMYLDSVKMPDQFMLLSAF